MNMFGAERIRKVQDGIRKMFIQNKTEADVIEWIKTSKLTDTISTSADAELNAEAARVSQIEDPVARQAAGEIFMKKLMAKFGNKMGLSITAE
jgi:hypothetical protein